MRRRAGEAPHAEISEEVCHRRRITGATILCDVWRDGNRDSSGSSLHPEGSGNRPTHIMSSCAQKSKGISCVEELFDCRVESGSPWN